MTALMKDETHAINTARQSAVKTKLKPRANGATRVIVLPDKTAGMSLRDRKNDAAIKARLSQFLRRAPNLAASGRRKAPITGIKTIEKSIFCMDKIKIHPKIKSEYCAIR